MRADKIILPTTLGVPLNAHEVGVARVHFLLVYKQTHVLPILGLRVRQSVTHYMY